MMFFKAMIIEMTNLEEEYDSLIESQRWLEENKDLFSDIALVLFPQNNLYSKIQNQAGIDAEVFINKIGEINNRVREVFSKLAVRHSAYISPGMVLEYCNKNFYRTGWLFNSRGELVLKQRQIFLSKDERRFNLARGNEILLEDTELGKIGFMLGTDCYYPEVGRFLALEGADIILAPSSIKGNLWKQLAGVWSQVQQNQFIALEAAGSGQSLIHAPCEISPFKTGIISPVDEEYGGQIEKPAAYLQRLKKRKRIVGQMEIIEGAVEMEKLRWIRKNYPLKRYLNSRLYHKSGRESLLPGRVSDD